MALHVCLRKSRTSSLSLPHAYKYLSIETKSNTAKVFSEERPTGVAFAKSKQGNFIQEKPVLSNQYLHDFPLQQYLKRNIPIDILKSFENDLVRFGDSVAKGIYQLHQECEALPPVLIQQNAWGKKVNEVWTCHAWKRMKEISAEEGLIAIAYQREHGEWSRLYQMAKLYLFAPSSGLFSCPLAMTDGASKTIESTGPQYQKEEIQKAYKHLTSTNPEYFWTSGQWMTEKKGGSDVANGTETIAVQQSDGTYRLYGYKWFTSAVDSDMSLTLARIVNNGSIVEGTKGLSLFYLETKIGEGTLNNLDVIRLKDKLGTRQLPTAELLLDGTIAHRISEEGRGVADISTMLSITRLHNGCASVSGMRRILHLARDYSHKRIAFGQQISKYPLHIQTLARMEVEVRGSLLLFLEISKWLGKIDCSEATDEEQLLFRILTPVLKLYTAKQAMSVCSEGLEAFGGQGYMEDTGLPSLLRDAQVLPIWEGTTNILSLDVLRCIAKTNGAVMEALIADVTKRMNLIKNQTLIPSKDKIMASTKAIQKFLQNSPDLAVPAARDLAYSIARTYIGALLIDFASCPDPSQENVVTAQRWCLGKDLSPVMTNFELGYYSQTSFENEYGLVMEGYSDH